MHAVRSQSCLLLHMEISDYEDIYTEGITKITPEDMEYARRLGRPSNFSEPAADWQTEPVMQWLHRSCSAEQPSYSVNDVFNAVLYMETCLEMRCSTEAEQVKLPTASAVVGDIVDEAKHLHMKYVTNWNQHSCSTETTG